MNVAELGIIMDVGISSQQSYLQDKLWEEL